MGFWKGLGKGLLKAAPFAAMAIPGVGPLASAAIQAGLGAANAKVSGGGLKDVLLGAGMGAAPAGAGGAEKGLSPSKGFMSNLGTFAKQTGKNALASVTGKGAPAGWQGKLAQSVEAARPLLNRMGGGGPSLSDTGDLPAGMRTATSAPRPNATSQPPYPNRSATNYTGYMRGLGPVMGRRDQNFPNLAEAIGAGRQTAMANQPFRAGYKVTSYGPEDTERKNPIYSEMPPIYATPPRRRRQQQAEE